MGPGFPDLLGDDRDLPRSALRPAADPIRLSLFDHAAERAAVETGRAVSQERAEIVAPSVPTFVETPTEPDAWSALAVGDPYDRFGRCIVRIERRGDGSKPDWFVGPTKNDRQSALFRGRHGTFVEVEDDGLTIAQHEALADGTVPFGTTDDDFEDEDGPDFVDEGADVDAGHDPDALLAEANGDPDAVPEPAPVCDECKIAATIHEWASPHGREGFPCPPGSFERDRAAFEASIYAGKRTEHVGKTWEVTQHTYTRRTEDRPAWFTGDVLRADLARYRSANLYGAHWVERRVLRADLFTAAAGETA